MGWRDDWTAVLRGKDDVIEKIGVRIGHFLEAITPVHVIVFRKTLSPAPLGRCRVREAHASVKPGVERSGTQEPVNINDRARGAGDSPLALRLSPAPRARSWLVVLILGLAPQ